MAVRAQNPANSLDLQNRAVQLSSMESRTFFNPIPYVPSLLDDCQQQSVPGTAAVQGHQGLFQPVVTPVSGPGIPNLTLFHQPVVDMTTHAMGARKRRRESSGRRSSQQQQQQPAALLVDLNRNSAIAPQSGVVSTGLRLAFDDDRSTITGPRPEVGSAVPSSLRDELSAHLLQQQEELNQFLKSQADQLAQALEERTQRHSKSLLSSIEESLSRRLRERELEFERLNRRNIELEDRVKHLSVESHMWQSKAKSNEALVAILRTNLQQAVVQSREQSKEGCGDSEADDAASAHVDENADAQARGLGKAGEPVRVCRRCKAKEVSILLLPCLHLCLCNDCKGEVERCPLCFSLKSASVEVYLS